MNVKAKFQIWKIDREIRLIKMKIKFPDRYQNSEEFAVEIYHKMIEDLERKRQDIIYQSE